MAFPILALITVLPDLIKQIKTPTKSGAKEIAGIGILTSLTLAATDIEQCAVEGFNAVSCVTPEHLGFLAMWFVALLVRLNGKRGEQ
jgi:hypothetical protein